MQYNPDEWPSNDDSQTPPAGPLAGIVVADFSRVLAGPYCTMLLADMGATVIKVESPLGDDTRTWTPPERDGEATYYLSVNRNKYSIVLDFADEGDREAALDLAARADVLVENFRPGSLAKFKLDYTAVSERNPSIVYASITGFGGGDGAGLPGYDLLVQAASGLMSVTGSPDDVPYRAGVAVFDVITGLHAAMGVLAALHHRDRTGEGQHIELNLLSSALSGMVNQTAAYITAGVVPNRAGNEHPSLYPYEPMPTADGSIVIACGNNAQFVRLCNALDLPDVAADPRFRTPAERNANRVALRPLLQERLAHRPSAEWFDYLSAQGIACAPIQSVKEGVEFAERLGLEPVAWAGEGERRIPTVRHPVTFGRTPVDYRLAPPALGQDNDLIRAWLARSEPTYV